MIADNSLSGITITSLYRWGGDSKVSQGKENFYGENIESKILKDIVQNRRKSWEK
jgi:hypothetical protein